MPSLRAIAGIALAAACLGPNALLRRPPRRVALAERLRNIPADGLPLRAPVRIRWNAHQIPFIEAEHDRDLAVALGIVHAHLRLAQIEIMRRLAQGRIAELLGPAALELDAILRTLDFCRAVPQILAALPAETRDWLQGFADGVNAVVARAPKRPHEFALLGIRPEPWTLSDLLALGRLAATDFTWRVWINLLRLRGRPDWPALWRRLMRDDSLPLPSFAGSAGLPAALERLLGPFERSGSNALAVSAGRSATRGALLAGDPHLSFLLPNLWLVAGCRSPSYHLVGMMIPGVPVVAFGRNARIGWAGTNLHAASSELFDVTDLPPGAFAERRERIKIRWWPDRAIIVRDSDYGPVLSDTPLLRGLPGRRLALHWIGHMPTDELTAMLAVNRARNWDEFRRAIDGFAVPAQNMIYADAEGHVGQAMAARLPRRPAQPPADLFLPPEARRHWDSFITAEDLPAVLDPPQGFVASANDRPQAATPAPIGFFFSPDDRIRRIGQLLEGEAPVTVERLQALQRDVMVPSAPELRDVLLRLLRPEPDVSGDGRRARLLAALRGWDGRYDADSAGALAFEMLVCFFARALHGGEDLALYAASWDPWALLREDLAMLDAQRLAAAAEAAAGQAAAELERLGSWGEAHRLRLAHLFAAAPGIGRRYRFVDAPVAGGNETLMKTAHGFSTGRHAARFGANARYISDFGDPDANWFLLLGGQDGWLGSTTFLDQYELWLRGEYVRVPLSPEAVRAQFPYETLLTP